MEEISRAKIRIFRKGKCMSLDEQFQAFWVSYPRRVGKGTARTVFSKAIKKTTLEDMLKAITEYVANKPDWMDYKHPATWLRSEGWEDQWEPPQPKSPRYGNPEYKPASKPSQTREEYIRAEIERAERSFR